MLGGKVSPDESKQYPIIQSSSNGKITIDSTQIFFVQN